MECRLIVGCRPRCMFLVLQLERLGVAETGGRNGKRPGLLQRRRVGAPSAEEDSDSQSSVEDGSDGQTDGGQGPMTGTSAGDRLSTISLGSRAASRALPKATSPTAAGLQPDAEAAEQPAAKRQRLLGTVDVKAAAAAAREELSLPGVAALFTL